jgi:hypothetical protein
MKYVAAEIDGGVNERVGDAAILGLDVIGDFAHFHVGIVTKKHRVLHLFPAHRFESDAQELLRRI